VTARLHESRAESNQRWVRRRAGFRLRLFITGHINGREVDAGDIELYYPGQYQ